MRLARLAERYGADAALSDVIHDLTRDCPYSYSNTGSHLLPKGCRTRLLPPYFADRRPAPEGD